MKETVHTGENETAEPKASYDAYGKPLSMTDAQGNTTKFEYDRHDNLICVTKADGSKIRYEVGVDGNITKVIYPDGVTTESAV
ncbi:MAG: hypothetical protein E7294_06525 [Lachnospiraceae bacterium]|nr:hypothetical protein [Lachnospiraceae bacterium]